MTSIARVETHLLSVPLHTPFVTALRRTETTDTVVVRLTDSDGRVGWGEAPQVWQVTGESLASARACLEQMLIPAVRGLPLGDAEDLCAAVQVLTRTVARNHGAKAALDSAIHAVVAQAHGQSVAELLGGEGTPPVVVPTDVTISAGEREELAATAQARVAEGFTTLKLKIGTDAAHDVERVRAVRDEVGPSIALRLDANQGWSREEAVSVVRALEDADLGIEAVEQPVAGEDVEGLAWVRERVGLPIMADESCWGTWDLERIIRLGAADAVNVKLAKCGSLRTAVSLLRRAHEAGLGTIVGSMMESHIGIGAAASVVAAAGTSLVSDLDAGWWSRHSPVVGGIGYDGAAVLLSPRPGYGITELADAAPE